LSNVRLGYTAHVGLGVALAEQEKLPEAVAVLRKAIRLDPASSDAYHSLGVTLYRQGKFPEAAAAYQKAAHLKKDDPEAYDDLGEALYAQGKFREALASYRRGHQLGLGKPGSPSARRAATIREVERVIEVDRGLPAFLAGKRAPAGPDEQIALAQLCQHKTRRLYAASARFYGAAFAARGALADDLDARHRYAAAYSAALAGCGNGEDRPRPDGKERARLRRQALDWLRADLAVHRKHLDSGKSTDRTEVQAEMRHWRRDPNLATVREPAALERLPEAERRQWQKLWADVTALLERAAAR
jgi:tetratricopeptide (TPR) repeat protein